MLSKAYGMVVPMAAPPPAQLAELRKLGDLTLSARVGRGRTTTTYAAWDGAGAWHAVRVLNTTTHEPELAARAARPHGLCLDHPAQPLMREGPTVYATAPLIAGESLSTILEAATRERRPLPLSIALTIALGVARQLGRLPAGEIHGDLVPHHILVGYDGYIELVDAVGLKGALKAARAPGRAAYRSPEHVRGMGLGPHSDVYLLGIHLFEMSTAIRLFADDDDPEEVGAQIVQSRLPRPRELVGDDYPIELQLVLRKLLRPTQAGRFVDAPNARDALRLVATTRDDIGSEALGDWLKETHSGRWSAWQAVLQTGPTGPTGALHIPSRADTDVVRSSARAFQPTAVLLSTPHPSAPLPATNIRDLAERETSPPEPERGFDEGNEGERTDGDPEGSAALPLHPPTAVPAVPDTASVPSLPMEVHSAGPVTPPREPEPGAPPPPPVGSGAPTAREAAPPPTSLLDLEVPLMSDPSLEIPDPEDTDVIPRTTRALLTADLLGALAAEELKSSDNLGAKPTAVLEPNTGHGAFTPNTGHGAFTPVSPEQDAAHPAWDANGPTEDIPDPSGPEAEPPTPAASAGARTDRPFAKPAPAPIDRPFARPVPAPGEPGLERGHDARPTTARREPPRETKPRSAPPGRPPVPVTGSPTLEETSAEGLVVPVSDDELERVSRRRSFVGWLLAAASLAAGGVVLYLGATSGWISYLAPTPTQVQASTDPPRPAAGPRSAVAPPPPTAPPREAAAPQGIEPRVPPRRAPATQTLTRSARPRNAVRKRARVARPARVLLEVIPSTATIVNNEGERVRNGSYVDVSDGPVTLRVTHPGYDTGVFLVGRGRRRPLVVVLDRTNAR